MSKTGQWGIGPIAILLCLSGTFFAYAQDPQMATSPSLEYNTESASRLDEISAELASLKAQLAQKADKTDNKSNSNGWSAPKFGGRFFMDYITVADEDFDGIGALNPALESSKNWYGMREARITMTGTGYDFLDYKLELGFEKNGDASYKDIFLGIKNVPFFEYMRIGHQYVEDAGSEICNGTTNYTFMEAPAPAGQHFTARRLGLSSRHLFADDRGRLFFGAYGAQNISDTHYRKDDNQGVVLNSRLTYAPYFCHDGRDMFLVGGYYRASFLSEGSLNIARPKPGGWSVYDLESFAGYYSDCQQKAGFETVYQHGRFCVQTDLFVQEYSDVHNATTQMGDQQSYGGFVMARLFLTNDFRKYNQANACWGGVDVSCPFRYVKSGSANHSCGLGAWEVAAMYGFYNHFRLDSTANSLKYENQQVGAALNWHWNQHVKWGLNYIHDVTDLQHSGNDYSPTGDYLGMTCRVAF